MITAIIRNKENTLVLELPHSIYDIYEKLQSIGIMQPPKQIPLTDNEDEDIGVKLFSESDFGRHLLLTLHEKNTIADANMLTLVIGAASEDIKEELEQNVLYDQYGSMDEVISAVRQMTQDAGPVKAVFFCPLVGNIDEGDGDMFTVGDSYLADSADEIADALNRYTANDENDMATYYNKDDGVKEKLTSAVWSVELYSGRLFGQIDCSLKEALTAEETEALRDWLTGQCSDGLGEGFEQQPINRLDYGKKYCHHSPSIEETLLQDAVMRAIMQTAKQNIEVLKTLKIHIGMGLTDEVTEDKTLDIQIRIAEIDAEFQKMLKAVSADNADGIDEERITELMNEKQRLTVQLEQYATMRQKRESAKSRLDEIFTILDGLQNHPMEYDDTLVRQIIECVVVESKEKIKVVFIGGTEIEMTL